MSKHSLLLGFVLFFLSYGRAQQFFTKLENAEQFKKMSGAPLNTNLGQLESVKVIVELQSNKVYFINSKIYQFHLDFCTNVLKKNESVEVFNNKNYGTSENREFLLANVNFNPESDLYFIDLSVFDQMQKVLAVKLYNAVRDNSFFKENLALLLNTERLLALENELKTSIKVITPADLYKDQNYQLVSAGKCIGQLRFEPNLDSLKTPLHPEDILITHGTPKYFPNVSAIITDEFQTPLSHLSILGKNRKIPIAVDKKLLKDTSFLKMNGQWINLQTLERGVFYRPAQPKYRDNSNVSPVKLKCDTITKGIVNIDQFEKAGPGAIGNKAYNFGFLDRLQEKGKYKTPESSFAIPFYYYVQHTKSKEIQDLLKTLQSYKTMSEDSLRKTLKALQYEIKHRSLDPVLVTEVRKMLEKSEFTTFRFRSSTNAEDAKGFSGAGLYESKTVDIMNCEKSIEKAVVNVWASLWSYEAFQERRFFHISDENLAMGILVHRSFPKEEANGVVITKNVYRPKYYGLSVNVQFGDISVVQPPEGVICDQLTIVYEPTGSGFDRTVEYISRSNQGNGESVLSPEDLQKLEFAVETIKKAFWQERNFSRTTFYEDFGLDIEFKFQGPDRQLYIKQVRYFND